MVSREMHEWKVRFDLQEARKNGHKKLEEMLLRYMKQEGIEDTSDSKAPQPSIEAQTIPQQITQQELG